MEHYVTLFDSLFLPQGLALHMSMERHIKNYTLWILCVDDDAYDALIKLSLPNVRLLQLSKLETENLLRVKSVRKKGEYCWTLTPFASKFVFEADPTIERITYLDADLWFRKDPQPIFDEFNSSGKQVLITDHAYAPEYDQSETSGQYCVQFMIFTRKAEVVRKWWEDRCIEWCYARFEDGKFGDQKYLDDWPIKFPLFVHVLQDKEKALAPWNAIRFPYSNAIFYHFHGLRFTSQKNISLGWYRLPRPLIKQVYYPYINDLKLATKLLKKIDFTIQSQVTPASVSQKIIQFLQHLYKLLAFDMFFEKKL